MHSTRASPALRQLAEEDPALAVLGLWCQHRDSDTGLAETRGETIYYGPRFEALGRAEQMGLAAHHILHVAFRHSDRAADLQARLGAVGDVPLFTLAADALINETLQAAGFALPRPAVLATELLAKALGHTQRVEAVLADWDAERLFLALTDPIKGRGAQDTPDAKARAYAASKGFEGDLHPQGGAQAAGEAPGAAEWSERLARALAAGRQAGRGIGALGIRFGDLPRSHTPWERQLRAVLANTLLHQPRRDATRPARSWLARDAAALAHGQPAPAFEPGIAPTRHRARLAVGLDMSSSVTDGVLRRFAAEIAAIARRSGAEVYLLPFDETVRPAVRLDPAQAARQMALFGFARDGGTDFAPVLQAAAALSPALILMLTDLDAALPPPPGRIPVLWACLAPPAALPRYGRVIVLEG